MHEMRWVALEDGCLGVNDFVALQRDSKLVILLLQQEVMISAITISSLPLRYVFSQTNAIIDTYVFAKALGARKLNY